MTSKPLRARRRTLLALLSASLLQPHFSLAQVDNRVRRIGVFLPGSRESFGKDGIAGVEQGMREVGYDVRTNLVIEWQFANERIEDLDRLAAELVRKRVEVVLTSGRLATVAAQKATKEIPIVFAGMGDPVASGVVSNLARPGGNVTGTANFERDLIQKRLELLTLVMPKMTRVAYIGVRDSPGHDTIMRILETAARKIGVEVLHLPVGSTEDIERAFVVMKQERVDAAIWPSSHLLSAERLDRIGALALKDRIPTIGPTVGFARRGGLMSYGANVAQYWKLAYRQVAKILKGAKPGDLPVEQSDQFNLTVNLKTARSLGLAIPREVLTRATTIIE